MFYTDAHFLGIWGMGRRGEKEIIINNICHYKSILMAKIMDMVLHIFFKENYLLYTGFLRIKIIYFLFHYKNILEQGGGGGLNPPRL